MPHPIQWGHAFWPVVHLICFLYPMDFPAAQQAKQRFINDLWLYLPCMKCTYHCRLYFEQNPPPFKDKDNKSGERALFKWSVDFHNAVNEQTGKRKFTYEEAEAQIVERFFSMKTGLENKRADDVRKEDHKEIERLKNELNNLKRKERNPHMNPLEISLIVVCVIAVLFILYLFYYILKRTLKKL